MQYFFANLWITGFRLRCPVCEQGHLFSDWFKMNAICPHCSVRFERHQGEEVGGMAISVVVSSVIFLVGYIVSETNTDWPLWVHLGLWVPFALLFPVGFYRHSRALWVVLLHAAGDVYWDTEPYEESQLSIRDAFFNRSEPPPSKPIASDPAPRDEDDDLL